MNESMKSAHPTPDGTGPSNGPAPLAGFENVVKRYGDDGPAAVDGLSLELPADQVCGLLGPQGSGKTTVLRLLLGLTRPDSGSVTLLGCRPGSPEHAETVLTVGTTVDGPAIDDRATPLENMQIRAEAVGRPGDPDLVGCLEEVGLSHPSAAPCGSLSPEDRRLLGVAIALVGRPRLVVLDEPTAGLGPEGAVAVRELIKRLPARGTSVLVSSHLPADAAAMCDHMVILRRGQVAAAGGIHELVRLGRVPAFDR